MLEGDGVKIERLANRLRQSLEDEDCRDPTTRHLSRYLHSAFVPRVMMKDLRSLKVLRQTRGLGG
jgi:hypothetical protein